MTDQRLLRRVSSALALLPLAACALFPDLEGLAGTGIGDAGQADTGQADTNQVDANQVDANPTDAGPGDASVDAATDSGAVWIDTFNRPDTQMGVGNGWLMKSPGAFRIDANGVLPLPSSAEFYDNIVYRPGSEDLQNVAVTLEVQFKQFGFAQVFVRVQQDSVQTPANVHGYSLFFNASNAVQVVRNLGNNYTPLATASLASAIDFTSTYRLMLSVTGANPVSLTAEVEKLVLGSWTSIGQTSFLDFGTSSVTKAGAVGFSASQADGNHYRYDNFVRTRLP